MIFNPCPKPSKKKRVNRGGNTKNKLRAEFEEKEIYGCEVCRLEYEDGQRTKPEPRCARLDPAHRHERVEYRGREDQLWTFNQVIQAGRWHHDKLDDGDKEYRESVFLRLRGRDELYDEKPRR